ncbi:MAG: hypothetical protein C5B51_29895 [Terriglobia bacterium]|nr:MAG: hypothetical protein C5B51_29895 [Terriglobia bacterium]
MFAAMPTLAHHSLEAEYDPHQIATFDGTITKTDWSNPHVHFFVDVKTGNETVNWDVEMGSPNAQILRGWKIGSVKHGDHVVISAYKARDGSHSAFARKITRTVR